MTNYHIFYIKGHLALNQFRNSLFVNCNFVIYIHSIDGSKYAKVTKDSKNKVTKWNCHQERTCLTPQVTKKGTTGNIPMATPHLGKSSSLITVC